MAHPRIITGIDIGSHSVRVVVSEIVPDSPLPRILGVGKAESRGLRHGYIMSVTDAARSVRAAIDLAEKEAGVRVRDAYISVGGVGLESAIVEGSAIISRADKEITELDVDRAQKAAESSLPNALNKKILHVVPIEHKVDGQKIYGHPDGMKGLKLEVRALVITSLGQHLDDLMRAVEDAGIEVLDVIAAPLAASFVALTKSQKMAGCILANIGAETISLVVFEDGIPVSLEVLPVGSTDITNDIALGLKIPLEEAELVKLGQSSNAFPKKKLNDIVLGRLEDMFTLIIAHLKKIGKHELLPAGIVLTGGGTGIETIEDFARASMKIPSRIPNLSVGGSGSLLSAGGRDLPHDTAWFVAYGLTVWGAGNDAGIGSRGNDRGGQFVETIKGFFREFLP